MLLLVFWLLWKASSATSLSCFGLGLGILVLTRFPAVYKKRKVVHLLVVLVLAVSFSALFLNVGGGIVQSLGRDPTLTGRTDVWEKVLQMASNPLFGTGFESFWLGERLKKLWSIYWWHPNEAHNGYIEVYLNLGWTGILLLAVVLGTAYKRIVRGVFRGEEAANLRLAFLVVALTYNFTEAAFKMLHPVWITLLFAMFAVPRSKELVPRSEALLPLEADVENVGTPESAQRVNLSRQLEILA
jgi:O-antigen ligase